MYEKFLSKYCGTNIISLEIDDGSHGIPEETFFYHAISPDHTPSSRHKHPVLAGEGIFALTDNHNSLLYWYQQTLNFLRMIASELTTHDATFSFINYGSTELVFLLQEQDCPDRTVIISQPYLPFGTVKQEFQYLQKFYNRHPHDVIRPLAFINDDLYQREAYVTPYVAYAGCVSNFNHNWGEWTTLPDFEYHFSRFTRVEHQAILTAIIAKLVYLYDDKLGIGISDIHLRSGDFILDPLARIHFSPPDRKNLQSVIPNATPAPNSLSPDDLARYYFDHLTLTTIRNVIKTPFDDYIKQIETEFAHPASPNYNLNTRSDCSIRRDLIAAGIALGLALRATD